MPKTHFIFEEQVLHGTEKISCPKNSKKYIWLGLILINPQAASLQPATLLKRSGRVFGSFISSNKATAVISRQQKGINGENHPVISIS